MRTTPLPSSSPLENGLLRSLTLTNFKSHSHFSIHFGPHVNFLVGPNGSGKSALLAALIHSLGGNANKHSATAQGSKAAHGLIQDGKDHALIHLVLYNGGEDPYCAISERSSQSREHAADEVTVDCELTRLAGNKVKTAYRINGVTCTRRDVLELAEHFNLQVENPCAILTQAVHATFLRDAKDAHKRYEFFLAACNADVVRDRLRGCLDHQAQIAAALATHEARGAPLAEEVARCTALVEQATQRDRLEREVSEAEGALAWAEVRRAEAELRREAAGVGALHSRREAAEQSHNAADAELAALRQEAEAAQRERESRLALIAEASRAKAQAGAAHRAAQRAAAEAAGAAEESAAALAASRARLGEIQAAYERGVASIEADRRAAVERINSARTAAEAEVAAATGAVEGATGAFEEAAQAARAAKARAADAARRAAELKRQAEGVMADAARARAAAGNVLRAFGDGMPKLVEAIGRTQWPSGVRPVGPLGRHIMLRPAGRAHAFAVEQALGGWGGLSSFVVETHADERELRSLIARVAPALRQVRVLIQPTEVRFRVAPSGATGYPTVLDVLDVAQDAAFNALLNGYGPERVLLINSYEDAKTLWARASPFRAYEPDGTLHYLRGRLESSERPDQRFGGRARGLLAMDSADVVAGLEQQHVTLAAEAADAASVAQQVGREADAARRAEEAAGRERASAIACAKAAERNLATVARAALADDLDDRLGALRADLREIEGEVFRLTRETAERQAAVSMAEANETNALRLLRSAEAEVRALGGGRGGTGLDDMSGLEERLRAATSAVHKKRQAAERAAAAIRQAEVDLEARHAAAANVRARVEALFPSGGDASEANDDATQPVGAAVPPTIEELKKRLDRLRAALRKAEKAAGGANAGSTTYAALVGALREAEAAFAAHTESVAAVRATADGVGAALRERQKFHRRAIKLYGRQAVEDFRRHLSYRTLGGTLTFDHASDTLAVEVCPNGNDPTGRATSSLRSLSGGEQAFSTLSLILAMWQLSATPLRAMDEFDKNMDSNFQTASLVLLFETFRRQPGRQFLILTPLDYSGLLADAGVRDDELLIHRMPEVVRRG